MGPAVGSLMSQYKHLSFSGTSSQFELTHKPGIFPDTASVFAETAVCSSVGNGGWRFTQSASKAKAKERSYRAVVRWAVEMQRLDGLLEVSDEHGASVPAVYHLYFHWVDCQV